MSRIEGLGGDEVNRIGYDIERREWKLRAIGLVIVFSVFGGLGAWAALAPLDGAALAPGVVTVENYRKTVQHLEGGIVKSIGVRDGQSVEKDQVLLTLDDTQPRAQLEVLRGQYFIAVAREARLGAQRDELPGVDYPDELLAHQDDSRVREAMRLQHETFKVRQSALDGEISVYRRQIEQLNAQIKGMQAQAASRETLIASYRHELADFSKLLKQGYSDKQKVREQEREIAENEGERGELLSNIAAAQFKVGEIELKIMQITKDFQREVAAELGEVQDDLFQLKERTQSLEDQVSRTVVRAPEAGMVLGLTAHTVGAVIQPGGHLLDIVPQHERLIVEAQVAPADIDRLHPGQVAEVRFSAFDSRETPRIDGTLVNLSADRLIDESSDEKRPYYLARVEVSPAGLKKLADMKLKLVPGMPAEVLVNTGSRTLAQYLVKPLQNVAARSLIED